MAEQGTFCILVLYFDDIRAIPVTQFVSLHKKATIHQVTTMLVTSKNVLLHSVDNQSVGSSVPMVMTWKLDIFRSGLHGGYLVDNGFLCSVPLV